MPLTPLGEQARQLIIRLGMCGAREELSRMNGKHPEDDDLRAFYALTLLWSGRMQLAEQALLCSNEPSAGVLAVQSELEMFRGFQVVAQEILEQAEAMDPDHYLVLRSKVSFLILENCHEEARLTIQRAVALFPEDPEVFNSYATELNARKAYEQLEAFLDNCPEWFKATSCYHASRGHLASGRRQLSLAEDEYQRAVAIMPTSDFCWGQLSRTQVFQGKVMDAETSANYALELNPANTTALSIMQKIATDRGDREAAIQFEARRREANPGLSDFVEMEKANSLIREGKVDAAVKVLSRLKNSNQPTVARSARSITLLFLVEHNRWDQAAAQISEIEKHGEMTPSVVMAAAQVLSQQGKLTEAAKQAKDILEKNEGQYDLYPGAIRVFIWARSSEDIVELVERLKHPDFGSPDVVASCIMALDTLSHEKEARAVFDAVYRRFPNNNLMKSLAVCYAAEDDDLRRAFHLMRELPPYLRPRIGTWNMLKILLLSKFKKF